MKKTDTNVSVKYTATLNETPKNNFFSNIPDDLKKFIHNSEEGTLRGIVENLEPNMDYEIEISIRSVK